MTMPNENPYAPPRAETTLTEEQTRKLDRAPILHRIVLVLDTLSMLWVAVSSGLLFTLFTVLYWDQWGHRPNSVLQILEVYGTLLVALYYLTTSTCGMWGNILLLRGKRPGLRPTAIRIVLMGIALLVLVGFMPFAWAWNMAEFQDVVAGWIAAVVFGFWWLVHALVVRNLARRWANADGEPVPETAA